MNLGNGIEVFAYAISFALAVSCGLNLGIARSSRHSGAGLTSGVLIVVAVILGGIAVGGQAPWVGPIFAVTAVLTTLLAAAWVSSGDPAFKDESFGSRMVLVLSPRRNQRLAVDEERNNIL